MSNSMRLNIFLMEIKEQRYLVKNNITAFIYYLIKMHIKYT